MRLALNAKLTKLFKVMGAQFLGVLVIMLTIPIASTNGPVKKRQNAHCVKIYGQQLRQQKNDVLKTNSNINHFSRVL